MSKGSQYIDNLIIQKWIYSLENDYKRWERKSCGTMDGTYTRWDSPKYKSKNENTFSFSYETGSYSTSINGVIRHRIPLKIRMNPFHSDMKRIRDGMKGVKNHTDRKNGLKYEALITTTMNGMIKPTYD